VNAFIFEKTRTIQIEDETVTIKIADQGLRFKVAAALDKPGKSEKDRAVEFFQLFLEDWTFKGADGSKAPIDAEHILNLDPMMVDTIMEEVIAANPFLAKVMKRALT
jgi:hypothetical protein